MERILALYDSDIFYVTRFIEYFKKKRDFGFEIVVFTSKDSLIVYLRQHTVEILLLGEQVAPEDFSSEKVRYIYRLADESGVGQDVLYPFISKYQAAQSVMSEIKADYLRRENSSGNISLSRQMKITAIFTPAPELEDLLFSWSLGLRLSEHKKVLLVLLELLPVRIISTTNYSNQALSEFIYYLKEKSDVISRMKPLLGYEGNLSYLAGAANGADILAINKEDIHSLAAELKAHTDYQEIIFYLGGFTEAAMELLEISDIEILLCKDSIYGSMHIQEMLQQLERTGGKVLEDRIIKLCLPEEKGIKHLPLSIPELTTTVIWNYVMQKPELLCRTK